MAIHRDRWGWGFTQGFGGGGFSPFLTFNGTTTVVNCGSDASLDDLADAEMVAEAWIRADGWGENNVGRVVGKPGSTDEGWFMSMNSSGGLAGWIVCATTDAVSYSGTDDLTPDGKWHHVAMYFNDADGVRKIWLAIDGVWVASYGTQTAGVGAIVSDASKDFLVGNDDTIQTTFDGSIGWVRVSDNARYTPGAPFTPPARTAIPASDANTALLLKMDEGSGTTAADSSGNGNNGTITDGVWAVG